MGSQSGDLLFDLARGPQVVGIEKRDVSGIGELQTEIARSGNSAIGARDHPDTAVRACEALDDFGCAIGRSVVDDQHVQIGVRLVDGTAQCPFDVAFHVVGRHDDRHFWEARRLIVPRERTAIQRARGAALAPFRRVRRAAIQAALREPPTRAGV